MEKTPTGKHWVAIKDQQRRKAVGWCLGGVVAGTGLAWALQYSSNQLNEYWWYVLPLWAVLIPASLFYFFRKGKLVPTAEAMTLQAARQAESERETAEIEQKWSIRYPIAGLLLGLAWYLYQRKPELWWVALLLALGAAVHARELLLFILGSALLVAAFVGLAALPVSLAIVLAGGLIAYGVCRAKDPSIDTKLPLVGGIIQRRREAKQRAELLKNPFFSTLDLAVRAFWYDEPQVAEQVNSELRESIRTQLIDEGITIANSENPVQETRRRLVDAVSEASRLQVLVIPPALAPDETGIRGQHGVSGELKAHLLELSQKSKDLREWLHGFGEVNTFEDLWTPVLLRHWITLARANVLSALRRPLGDAHPVNEMDWYRPYLVAQCGAREHEYRECLGMPSNLAPEPIAATLEHLKLLLFTNCVEQGAKYPDLDWKDRCAEVDKPDPADAAA